MGSPQSHGKRISLLPKSPSRKSSSSSSSSSSSTSTSARRKKLEDSETRWRFPFRKSRFITTSRMIRLFSQPPPPPVTPKSKVVYINGGWDMFHAGHANILEKAKELGDYLLVGIYNDAIVNHFRGGTHPVLNLNERVLSVLACKYVDDVIIDPPYKITAEFIKQMNITAVVTGKKTESQLDQDRSAMEEHDEVFQVAKDMNILITMESGSNFEMSGLLKRVHLDSVRLEKKVKKKMMAEGEFYKEKHGLKDYDTTNK